VSVDTAPTDGRRRTPLPSAFHYRLSLGRPPGRGRRATTDQELAHKSRQRRTRPQADLGERQLCGPQNVGSSSLTSDGN